MPRVNDGALLFLETMLAKMAPPEEGGNRIAIIFNGSPLSNGDCGSGESEIRRWILENDWLDAIVMLPDQLFYNTGIFTYVWLLRNDKPADHKGRVMLIDARQQFEKEPKSFGNKRHRITDDHRAWIEARYAKGWAKGYADAQVKIFPREDFAYHKVSVVFWQTDEHDQPATVTEPYQKAFTAANVKKEQGFHESDLSFRVRVKATGKEKTVEFTVKAEDNVTKKFREALADADETLSVEWTHRYYVQDDEYIPHGEGIEAFLEREIAKPIIRWEETKKDGKAILGYEILPNKYFYRYQPPTPAKDLLAEFWKLEKEAEKMLEGLKARVTAAHISAARRINHELMLLYWDIGCGIVEKQQSHGWGDSVVEQIAADLKDAFPGTSGFSRANIWRMRQFYLVHNEPEFLAQVARELGTQPGLHTTTPSLVQLVPVIEGPDCGVNLAQVAREIVSSVPWGHHILMLGRLSSPEERFWYLRATACFGWSRNVLLNQIKAGAYERAVTEKKTHNFDLALPEHLAEQADEMLKSSYNLEFLGLRRAVRERDLEDRLVSRLQAFLLELGYGFCFVGRQHRIALGKKEYFIDLLFYHRFLKALVAFDLKVGPFEPEFAGKMDFYLNVLNDKERGPDDQPSIGIILCAEKDDVEVEYALRTKANPIGVAVYELQSKLPGELQGKLPTAKQLADIVRAEMEGGE